MVEAIIEYLINERNQKPKMAERVSLPLVKYDDICSELERWIKMREYPKDNPLQIEGYTAEDISKLATFLDGVGVYNFMVTLRERPENGKRIIAEGFPRK